MDKNVLHLLALILLVLEIVHESEGKIVKIRKVYRPKQFFKPPWMPYQGSKYYSRTPGRKSRRNSPWHSKHIFPPYTSTEEQSYTIEIDLPKRGTEYSSKPKRIPRKRKYEHNSEESESDITEDIIQSPRNKLKIRVIEEIKPKLRIKFSRNEVPDKKYFKQ